MPRSGTATQFAFYVACGFVVLSLLLGLLEPVMGVLQAVLFLSVATGIRFRQPWAPILGMCLLLIPVLGPLISPNGGAATRSLWSLVYLAGAGVLFWGMREMLGAEGIVLIDRDGWQWIVLIGLLAVGRFSLHPYVIPAVSMEPTLLRGDQVLAEAVTTPMWRLPHRGDIVVFRLPLDRRQINVKRVVAVPGDRLRLLNKRLYLNGKEVVEPYAQRRSITFDSYRDNFPNTPDRVMVYKPALEMLLAGVRDGELHVPAGQYFVLGDNRDSSLDSRYFGFLSEDDVIGRVILIYASHRPGNLADRLAPGTILNTRWSRIFKFVR